MTIHSVADIVGNSTAVQISATEGLRARRLFLCAQTTSNARFGDANVTATQGVELPKDTVVVISASDADPMDTIDLTKAYVYVPSGTTVTVTWVQ